MPNDANPLANTTPALTAVQTAQLLLALDSLVQDRHNLIVHLPQQPLQAPVVDWFTAMLADRWPQAQVQICQRLDGHRLIEAFNEALIPTPAAGDPASAAPSQAMQVWLVPEESFAQPTDMALVARLLQRFPLAPLRAILLLGPYTALDTPKGPMGTPFEIFHLDERPPSPQPHETPDGWPPDSQDAAEPSDHGLQAPAPTALSSASSPASRAEPAAAPGPGPNLPEFDQVVPEYEFTPDPRAEPIKRNLLLPAVVLSAAVLIGGLFWWAQGQPPSSEGSQGISGSLHMPAPVPVPALPAAAAPASGSSEAPVTNGPQPAVSAALVPPAPLPAADNSASAIAPAVASSARGWLASLPEQSLVVEHGRHDTLAEARRFMGARNYLNEARILAVQDGDTVEYLVVTGPFRSLDRANTYMRRLKIEATPLPVDQLRDLLPPGPNAGR